MKRGGPFFFYMCIFGREGADYSERINEETMLIIFILGPLFTCTWLTLLYRNFIIGAFTNHMFLEWLHHLLLEKVRIEYNMMLEFYSHSPILDKTLQLRWFLKLKYCNPLLVTMLTHPKHTHTRINGRKFVAMVPLVLVDSLFFYAVLVELFLFGCSIGMCKMCYWQHPHEMPTDMCYYKHMQT